MQLEKTEGAIMNGKSRDTGHTRTQDEDNQNKKTQHRKLKI